MQSFCCKAFLDRLPHSLHSISVLLDLFLVKGELDFHVRTSSCCLIIPAYWEVIKGNRQTVGRHALWASSRTIRSLDKAA